MLVYHRNYCVVLQLLWLILIVTIWKIDGKSIVQHSHGHQEHFCSHQHPKSHEVRIFKENNNIITNPLCLVYNIIIIGLYIWVGEKILREIKVNPA